MEERVVLPCLARRFEAEMKFVDWTRRIVRYRSLIWNLMVKDIKVHIKEPSLASCGR